MKVVSVWQLDTSCTQHLLCDGKKEKCKEWASSSNTTCIGPGFFAQVKDVRLIFRGSELPNWRPMTVFFENPVKRLLWAVRGGSAQASIRPFARSQTFRSKELLRILEEVRLLLPAVARYIACGPPTRET